MVRNKYNSVFLKVVPRFMFFISGVWQTFLNEADNILDFVHCVIHKQGKNKQMNPHGCVPKNFIYKNRCPEAPISLI